MFGWKITVSDTAYRISAPSARALILHERAVMAAIGIRINMGPTFLIQKTVLQICNCLSRIPALQAHKADGDIAGSILFCGRRVQHSEQFVCGNAGLLPAVGSFEGLHSFFGAFTVISVYRSGKVAELHKALLKSSDVLRIRILYG